MAVCPSDSFESARTLETLCKTYWYPLYSFVRRKGYCQHEAQDLTQEFFAHLLCNGWPADDPSKGTFRSYLLTAMDHFLANQWHRAHAIKRGGFRTMHSLDATPTGTYTGEPVNAMTPEKLYERGWALKLFEQARQRLRQEYTESGRAKLYLSLNEFLSAKPERGDYKHIAGQLGLSQGAIVAAVFRLRHRYSDLVREEVTKTLVDPQELGEELRSLLSALQES